jgi:hypothetical protein
MREVVMKEWCDVCWMEETKTEALHTFTVGAVKGESKPALKVLMMCDVHQKIILELQTVLGATGQTLVPAPVKPQGPAPAKRMACPACGQEVAAASIVGHVWSAHRPDTRPPMPKDCPECGEHLDNGTGMAAHRRSHGYDALAEAMSGVSGKDWPLSRGWRP